MVRLFVPDFNYGKPSSQWMSLSIILDLFTVRERHKVKELVTNHVRLSDQSKNRKKPQPLRSKNQIAFVSPVYSDTAYNIFYLFSKLKCCQTQMLVQQKAASV